MWKTVLDLLFPIHCLGCGQETQHYSTKTNGSRFICFGCFKKIPLNTKPPLKFNQSTALDILIIASYYKHPLVKQAILRYKYDFIKDLAKPLGQLMTNRLKAILKQNTNIFLIPVPLHQKRLAWRGFNQAELLALEIGQKLNIKVANNILQRIKHGLPQTNIKSSQTRKENIKQAFSLEPKEVWHKQARTLRRRRKVPLNRPDLCLSNNFKNKTIILIDDISTTGATLEECARALKPLQPKQIWGLVIAKG